LRHFVDLRRGLGFGVWAFRVRWKPSGGWGLGMGVEVVGFRVLGVGRNGPGLWVPGAFGFRFLGFRFRVSGSDFKAQGSGSEFRISGLGLTLWGFVTWRMYVSSGRSPC